MPTIGPIPVSTTWTGFAGNGLWNDPANWTNGVPPSGAPYTNGADNVATLDNSVETTPFTVTITGPPAGDIVNVNLTDPAAAPAVRLTGTLDLSNNVQPGGGGGLGTLNLNAGTFEVDGGTLRALTVEQGGEFGSHNGALTFGAAATYGVATLDAIGLQNEFTIGNGSDVVVKSGSFAIFEKDHGANQDTVTVNGGSTLDIEGGLTLGGVLDIQNGAVTIGDSGSITGESAFNATVFADGGTFTINGSGSLDNATIEGDMAVVATPAGSATVTVADAVTFENAPAAAQMVADLGGNTLDVTGTLDLLNADVENGTVKIESGAALKLDPAALANGFDNLTIDATAAAATGPAIIDLGGTTVDVAGSLSLRNVVLQNGTLNVEAGASVSLDATSSLNVVEQQAVSGTDDLGGTTLDVTNALVLDNATIANGTIRVENGATVAFNPAATTGGFDNLTIDGTASSSPVVIDLGGRTVDVTGALNLDNIIIQNGTLDLAINAAVNLDPNSNLVNVIEQLSQVLTGGTTTTLTGTPDVHITAPTNFTLQPAGAGNAATELDVNTGTGGTSGQFFIDAGSVPGTQTGAGTVSGAGLVKVTDSSGGVASTVIDGEIDADAAGQTLTLQSANWMVNGDGLADATNGANLVLGDTGAATSASNMSGGVLSNGSFAASGAGQIELVGDAPITTLSGTSITLTGANSDLVTDTPAAGGGQLITPLEQSLTSIGFSTGTFSAASAKLELDSGASFAAANSLDLFGSIVLKGGTIAAPTIATHASLLGGGAGSQLAEGTISGNGTVNAAIAGTGGLFDATGGTLTINGAVTSTQSFKADGSSAGTKAGTLVVNSDISGDRLELGAGTTITIGGHVTGQNNVAFYDGNGAGASTIDLGTPAGANMDLELGFNAALGATNPTFAGNKIHLEGVLLNEVPGSGTGMDLVRVSDTLTTLTVHLKDASGNVLPDAVFSIHGNIDNIGVTANADGNGGTILTFGDNSAFAKASVTVPQLPNAHVGATDQADLIIFNTSSGNKDQGNLNGKVGTISGNITATGAFTGLTPGHSTAQLNDPNFTDIGDGTPITVGVSTVKAGAISGKVNVILDQATDPQTSPTGTAVTTALKTVYVNGSGNVYDLANAAFPTTTFYLHRQTDPAANPFKELALGVQNKTITSAQFQEGLTAQITGSSGDFTNASDPSGDPIGSTSAPIAAGTTDTTDFSFVADTSQTAKDVQTGTINFHLASDGTGTSGLAVTDQGAQTANVTVVLNNYAGASMEGLVDTVTPDTHNGAVQPNNVDTINLETFDVNQNVGVQGIDIQNFYNPLFGGAHQDNLSGTFSVDPALQDSAFSNSFGGIFNLAPGAIDDTSNGFSIDTSPQALGTHTEGVIFHPLSVNPTDPAGTPLEPLEIIYTYAVSNDPNPTGGGWGDPHLTTFDGLHYDFQAAGDFEFVKSTKAGDNFEVQIRTAPLAPNTLVAKIEETAIEVGQDRVTINSGRTDAVWVDGSAVQIGDDGTLGFAGGGSIHHVGSGLDYVVTTAGGEQVFVVLGGLGTLTVNVQLGVNGPKGQVEGLLGNADGNYANDLQLADPNNPGQFITPGTSLSFGQLYTDPNSLANTWRITSQASSLLDYGTGQTPGTFNIGSFPGTPATLAELPQSVVASATAAVNAAGITDPTARADAILDYALTGNPAVIEAAAAQSQVTAPATATTLTVTNTPAPTALAGLSALAAKNPDNAPASAQVYLTQALTTNVTVSYAVVDPSQAGFLTAASFGGTLPSGTVTITAGQTTGTFQIALPSIGTDVTDEVRIAITGITTADNSTAPATVAPTIDLQVVNHAPTEGTDAQPSFVAFSGGGTLTHVGNAWTLDLGNLALGATVPQVSVGVANLGAAGANALSGTYAITGDHFSVANQVAPTNLGGGTSGGGVQLLPDNSALGTHSETITLDATQANASGFTGTLAPITLTVTDDVVSPTPPTLTPLADETVEATGPTGAPATFAATATDAVDGTDTVVFKEGTATVHSGDTFALGTHMIVASATDSGGRTSSETFAIKVQDTTPPLLTPVANQTDEATGPTGAAATFTATAMDIVDGTDPVVFEEGTTVVHSGQTFGIGTHTISASATDAAGNTASETFTIKVQDTTPPVLTPVANQTDEATGPTGAAATFTATATDLVDGTDPVVFEEGTTVVNSGQTFAIGTHTISASATDAAGNTASETFTIKVQDTTPPVLTPVANQTDEATGPTGAAATFMATATDLVDGTDPVVFEEGTTVVHSGQTFAIGTHTISASATDAAGNTASETFTIKVQDTTPPVLTPVANQTDEATGPTGAAATFTASATDLVDGSDPVVFKEGTTVVNSGQTFAIGTHTITASATDAAGNTASETFTIKVQDTTPPLLTPVANQTLAATGPGGAVATFAATATDLVDGTDPVVFKEGTPIVHSGDTFSIGTHTISASATDAAGNTASETFTITVQGATVPTVTSIVASPPTGDLGPGKTVTFTVTMSGAVKVAGVTAATTPFLALNDGGKASYAGGSGTNVLTFVYRVGALGSGQDTSGLAVTAFNADGATITQSGKPSVLADLSGVSAFTGGPQIDTVAPVVTSVATSGAGITGGNGDLGIGKTVTLTVGFSENVTVTGAPLLQLNDGGKAAYAGGSGSGALTFTYVVAAGQEIPDLAVRQTRV